MLCAACGTAGSLGHSPISPGRVTPGRRSADRWEPIAHSTSCLHTTCPGQTCGLPMATLLIQSGCWSDCQEKLSASARRPGSRVSQLKAGPAFPLGPLDEAFLSPMHTDLREGSLGAAAWGPPAGGSTAPPGLHFLILGSDAAGPALAPVTAPPATCLLQVRGQTGG